MNLAQMFLPIGLVYSYTCKSYCIDLILHYSVCLFPCYNIGEEKIHTVLDAVMTTYMYCLTCRQTDVHASGLLTAAHMTSLKQFAFICYSSSVISVLYLLPLYDK